LKLTQGGPGSHAAVTFIRVTDKTCATEVVFPELNIERKLPLNQVVSVDVPTDTARTLTFQCGMAMYKGALVVTSKRPRARSPRGWRGAARARRCRWSAAGTRTRCCRADEGTRLVSALRRRRASPRRRGTPAPRRAARRGRRHRPSRANGPGPRRG